MKAKKSARNSCNHYAPNSRVLVKKQGFYSVADFQHDRERYSNFVKGSYGAAALMCLMFAVLSFGAVVFGW